MSLLWAEARKLSTPVADPPRNGRSWVESVDPADILRYAEDRRGEWDMQHVRKLTEKFQREGYDPRKHGGMDFWGRNHSSEPADPIHLVHTDNNGSYLLEGNHRTHALVDAGIRKAPVLVSDFRGSF